MCSISDFNLQLRQYKSSQDALHTKKIYTLRGVFYPRMFWGIVVAGFLFAAEVVLLFQLCQCSQILTGRWPQKILNDSTFEIILMKGN